MVVRTAAERTTAVTADTPRTGRHRAGPRPSPSDVSARLSFAEERASRRIVVSPTGRGTIVVPTTCVLIVAQCYYNYRMDIKYSVSIRLVLSVYT